jgi:hypothetical protein
MPPLDSAAANPFDQFDAPAHAATSTNPFDQFDQHAPQWPLENPFPVPAAKTTQEFEEQIRPQIEALPDGSYYKTPTGDIYQKPKATGAADVTTGQPINYALPGAIKVPGQTVEGTFYRDTGILGAVPAGLVSAGKGVAATAQTLGGEKPAEEPGPGLLAAQPMHWRDFLNPKILAEKTLYGFAQSAPTIAASVFGGALGTAVGGGPEEPLGWAGAVAGTAAGAALGTTIQGLGNNFRQALGETKGDSEAAWNLAMKRTAIEAGGGGASFALFSVAPFAGAVKNLIFQAFGVQPAAAVAEQAISNVSEGRPATERMGEVIPGAVIGTAAPLAAHLAAGRFGSAALERLSGEAAPAQQPAPPSTAQQPPAAVDNRPPPGSVVNIPSEAGPVPMTVEEHTPEGGMLLLDPNGAPHRMSAEDVAKLPRAEVPGEAAQTPAAQGAPRPPVAPEAAPAPRLALPAPEVAYGPAQPWTSTGAGMIPGTGPAFTMRSSEETPALAALKAIAVETAARAREPSGAPSQRPSGEGMPEIPASRPAGEVASPAPGPEAAQAEAVLAQEAATPGPIAPIPAAEPAPGAPPLRDYAAEYEANRARAARTEMAAPTERPPIPFAPIREGTEPAFIPSTGAALPVQYGIADARDLVTSHHDDLSPNSEYPQALQPRSRERAETETQLAGILNGDPRDPHATFRPELLGENPDAANGSPIIGPEGYVESGNARTMAIRRAYDRDLPQAEQYREYLRSQGYPIEGVERPVLVRINRAGMDMPQREQLARDLNVSPQAAMSATDRAMADAQQINPEMLRQYQGGGLFSAANSPFWGGILRQIAKPNELPGLTNPEGGLSSAGQTRIRSAVLAKAYGDPDIVGTLTEDPDSNIKAIGNALTDAAPAWAQLRQAVAERRIPQEYDLTSPLIEAVRLVAHARDTGRNVAEFMRQRGLFGEGVAPETEGVLSWMLGAPDWTRRYGREKIKDALTEYASAAQRQAGTLGGARVAPAQLTEQARERAQGASRDLFAAPVAEPARAEAVRPVAGENRPAAQGQEPPAPGVATPTEEPRAGEFRLEETPREAAAGRSASPGTYRDTRDDYLAYRANTAYPETPEGAHSSARGYVRQRGQETGNEYLAVHDPQAGIAHVGTSDQPDRISFESEGLDAQLADPNAGLTLHHNHPGDAALSGTDIAALAHPGVAQIVAHPHNQDVFAARLTPEARAALANQPARFRPEVDLALAYQDANKIVRSALQMQTLAGKISPAEFDRLQADLVNRALDAAGIIDYVGTRAPSELSERVRQSIISRAAKEAGDNTGLRLEPLTDGEIRARLDRSALVSRPDEAMARISGIAPGAEQRGSEAAAPGSGAGIGAPEAGEEALVGGGSRGLAEEPSSADLSEEATHDTVEAALVDTLRPTGRKFDDTMGIGPNSPGRGNHFFNLINKQFTSAWTKAALDPLSQAKFRPELAKNRLAATLFNGYKDMPSWRGIAPADAREQFAAMELLTLEGREVPLDGSPVIVENRDYPLAELSKPSETVALQSPQQIQRFTEFRQMMDRVWQDQVTAHARRIGWTGDPSAAAIYKAATEAGESREGRKLQRMAKMLAAVEYQHRTSYLPLMRQGEYYLRVTPKAGTSDKPGILGWTGDGFPPTTMFKLMDPLSWAERAMGGMRSGTPRLAEAAIADLRKQFPEADYDIDHGYLFHDPDTIANLRIPAIEKLLMLSANDAEGLLRDNYTHMGLGVDEARSKARGDYDKITDGILDEIWQARVPGYKQQRRGIPGYEGDFNKSVGRYLGWLSNSTARLTYGQEIEAADEALLHHPDPRTRDYWRDWDRAQADRQDQQLYGPLMKLRQGAFYWLLGGNAATSAKILLHGPLRGAPLLGTGLGAMGRTQAAGEYLRASIALGSALRVGQHGIELDFSKVNMSPDERLMFKKALADNVIHEQTADEMRAMAQHGEQALTDNQRFFRRTLDIWASNVSAADRMVRGAMLLAAYRTANRAGMPAIDRVWNRDLNWQQSNHTPQAFARFMVDQAVGIWGPLNRLPVARSQLGGMLMQFRQYEVGYLSNLHSMLTRMGPEGRVTAALMLGGIGMMGGAVALPFFQDIEKAAAAAYQTITGISPDLDDQLKQIFDGMLGDSGEGVVHGLRPFGVDWSSIGFGDLLSRNAQSPLDLAGAAVSTGLGAPYRAYERLSTGQSLLAATSEIMPNAVRHMLQALYPEITEYPASGKEKIQNAAQISDADRIKMGLGMRPEAQELNYEKFHRAAHQISAYHEALTLAENRIANLRDTGDQAGANAALADANRLIAQGRQAGVFSPNEAQRLMADLRVKTIQRQRPDLGSATMQRVERVQGAQP